MDYITTNDGVRIAFDDVGRGAPVVMTHGWVIGREMWEYVAARLADDGLRAISVDRRGCGASDRPADGFDCDTLADDLAAVIEGLDLRGATLVAHSMAGAEAVRMLSRHRSARVERLVLVATTTPGPPTDQRPMPDAVEALVGGMRTDRPGYVRAGVPAFFGSSDTVSTEMANWGVGLVLRASLRASIAIMETMATTDTSSDLEACELPTLLLHGDCDRSAPLERTGMRTAALLPNAELKVYERAPHGLPLTHADRVATDVLRFIRETSVG